MKTHQYHSWKGILVALLLLGLVFSAQALEPAAPSQAVTLCATVRKPSGTSGTIEFTFELEELPVASAVLPNVSTLSPRSRPRSPNPPRCCWLVWGGWGWWSGEKSCDMELHSCQKISDLAWKKRKKGQNEAT
jgi:hypothetical protein